MYNTIHMDCSGCTTPYTWTAVDGQSIASSQFLVEMSHTQPHGSCSASASLRPASLDPAWYSLPEEDALVVEERRVYSQNGEDGVLMTLLKRVGEDTRYIRSVRVYARAYLRMYACVYLCVCARELLVA